MFSRYSKLLLTTATSYLTEAPARGHVVTFHEGRCGSTVLANQLSQHSRIKWDNELYRTTGPYEGIRDVVKYRFPALYLRAKVSENPGNLYGFEIKYIQHLRRIDLSIKEFLGLMSSLGISKFILLDRRNNLRRFVSTQVSLKRDVWNRKEKSVLTEVSIEVDSLLERLDMLERKTVEIKEYLESYDTLYLEYENHVKKDPGVAYEEVCRFLGIQIEEVSVELRKMNPFKLRDMLKNYQEVKQALVDTKYEWMLDG